jgi:hypothetical protein
MIKRIAALGTAVVVGASFVVLPSLSVSAGGGPTMTLTPDSDIHESDPLDLANDEGSECQFGEGQVAIVVHVDIRDDGGNTVHAQDETPDADGDWSADFAAPAPGDYTAHAECALETGGTAPNGGGASFEYVPVPFTVLESEPEEEFTFVVSPTSGVVGSTVNVSGEFCSPGLGDAVVVTFTEPDDTPTFDPSTDEPVGVFTVGPPNSSYSGTFEVPDVVAGAYQVNGFCVGEGGQAIEDPIAVPFTVLAEAEPPTPTPGAPDFTG